MGNNTEALTRGRSAAFDHMQACETAQIPWTEEPVTEILLSRSFPEVRVASFNRRQESKVGADWIWWWLGDDGESFGLLVQAKRLVVSGEKWKFKFDHNEGEQQRTLFASAQELDIAPVYGLYLGTGAYRGPIGCGRPDHRSSVCEGCERSSVSFLPAILTSGVKTAESTYERSVPMEELLVNSETQPSWLGAVDASLTDELRRFLNEPQSGPRAVARSLLDLVLNERQKSFSKSLSTTVRLDALGPVFECLPSDTGHFTQPYFSTMLRGLVHAPPAYITELLVSGEIAEPPLEGIAGVVLVHV